MIKQMISVGSIVILITSALVVLDIVPVANVKAGDPVWVVDHWETVGDWNINSTTTVFTYTSTTIIVNGNLTIEAPYTLTLQNVLLQMNCSYNGQYNITVKAGIPPASLIVGDLDGNPDTPADASIITSYTPDDTHNFGFRVEGPNGYLEMKNSELHQCGWNNLDPNWRNSGLNIQGANAIITGNEISDNFRGLILHNSTATSATVSNNTIHDNDATGLWISRRSTNHHIADNEIYSNAFGMQINDSLNPIQRTEIINNDIHDNVWQGIRITSSENFLIQGNTINNHTDIFESFVGTGLFLGSTHNTTIHDNYFENNGGDKTFPTADECAIFSQAGSGTIITDNYITGSNVYGVRVQYQADVTVENNEFIDNLGRGSQLLFIEIRDNGLVNNNIFDNAAWTGIFVDGCYNFKITNNTIENIDSTIADSSPTAIVQQNFYSAWPLQVYNYNNVISNITGTAGAVGMTLADGSDHVVDKITIYNVDSIGMSIGSDDSIIKNSRIYNIGTTSTASASEYVSGISLGGTNNVLEGVIVEDCEASPDGTNDISGLLIEDARDIEIKNSYFNGSEINIQAKSNTNDILIENSTLTKTPALTKLDFYLGITSHLTTLNTQFDNTSVDFGDGSSDLTVKWYVDVKVESSSGSPEANAYVWVNNTFGNNEANGTTDGTGWLRWNRATDYVEKSSGRTYYTPHNITAKKDTRIGLRPTEMWRTHDVTVVLNNLPEVTSLYPTSSSVYRTDPMLINAVGSDIEDNNQYLTPHFEYRVNETAPWISETDPGTYLDPATKTYAAGEYSIEFTPPASAPVSENPPSNTYDFRVRLNDTYPMYGDWWFEDNMVDVMNNPPSVIWVGEDSATVLRGDTVFIYADGDDKEDDDEDSSWDAECEYLLEGSGTWATTYINQSIWDSTENHWRFTFEPPGTRPSPNPGLVDFRVRFMDPDGTWNDTWYTVNDLVHVLNNIPEIQNMKGGHTDIYRDQSTWIFVNTTDVEEAKGDLTVEFWYDAPGGSVVWEQTYLSNSGEGQYDSSGEFFKVKFSPDKIAGVGYYGFKVVVTDADGDYIEHVESALVNVMNNPPIPEDILPSATKVGAGSGYIYIHVNATDIEDIESDMTCEVQWRYNETGTPEGGWQSTYLSSEPYHGTAPNGWLRVRFTPGDTAKLGHYDFQARVRDIDGDYSESPQWIFISRAVEVQEIIPTIEDTAIGESEVFRGQTAYIFLNASDTADREHELTLSIQYHLIGSAGWTDISSSAIYYDDTNGNPNDDIGFWVIEFNPSKATALGLYEFQVRVKNSANGYSNDGDYTPITGTVNVQNNLPTASELRIQGGSTVDRGGEIYIYADADDFENDPDDLIPHFEWSADGSNWNDNYLNSAQKPSPGANTWKITFSPPANSVFALGNYDFKVWFEDEDEDESNEVVVEDLVKVENVPPSNVIINVPSNPIFREESITVYATVEDADHGEGGLTAVFQYKGPKDSDWIDYDDPGSYFTDDPVYLSGQWQIDFEPAGDADLGQYSFRVQFSDSVESSAWKESLDVFEVKNNDPVVDITSPDSGTQSSDTITCVAIVTDDNDVGLTWEWDFGDDETSDDDSPSHTYTESGSYTVKVTVTDIDDGQGENTVTIYIPDENGGVDTDFDGMPDSWEEDYFGNLEQGATDDYDDDGTTNLEEYIAGTDPTKGEPKEESNMMLYLLLIIIVVVVVVLLLVFMLNKKKKKPEAGVQPSAPGVQPESPEAPGPGVPPAAAAAPIAEAPAPAEAAPMAAALPKTAAKSQQIKCPKCGTGFTVESAERPITIECPNCHAKGTLT